MSPRERARLRAADDRLHHGAWVTPLCWDKFAGYFSERGYACIAPPWPGKEEGVEALRLDAAALAGLGIAEIVDHYESIVGDLPAPPVLIGHSFGGLFVQLLLDRGLGAAGVAIDSAPPRGVNGVTWSSLRSLGSVLRTWRGWRKVVRWKFPQFRYAFVHTLPEEELGPPTSGTSPPRRGASSSKRRSRR